MTMYWLFMILFVSESDVKINNFNSCITQLLLSFSQLFFNSWAMMAIGYRIHIQRWSIKWEKSLDNPKSECSETLTRLELETGLGFSLHFVPNLNRVNYVININHTWMVSTQMVKTRIFMIPNYTINKKNLHVICKNIATAGPSFVEVIRSQDMYLTFSFLAVIWYVCVLGWETVL